jgi:hypothetical protein
MPDARRIVACVNACKGISTETLESVNNGERPILVTVKDRHEELTKYHDAIAERDAALAMVRELVEKAKAHSRASGSPYPQLWMDTLEDLESSVIKAEALNV